MPLQETCATFSAEGFNRVTFILDASDAAQAFHAATIALVSKVLFLLPASVERRIYFLGDPGEYPAYDFDRKAAQWFKKNRKRASLVTPVLEALDRGDKSILVIIGAGAVFDLEDWAETSLLRRMIPVSMGKPLQGERPIVENKEMVQPTDEGLFLKLHNPVSGVEISGPGFMPVRWSNDGYQLKMTDGKATLVAEKLSNYSLTIQCLTIEPGRLQAIVTRISGERVADSLEKASRFTDSGPSGHLSNDEARIFSRASREKSFTCLSCGQPHSWNQLYCLSGGSIIGKPIYPSLQIKGADRLVVLRKEKARVEFKVLESVLQLGPDEAAVKVRQEAAIYRFDDDSKQWIPTGRTLSLYQHLEGAGHVFFL